jgi:hypothetical protein
MSVRERARRRARRRRDRRLLARGLPGRGGRAGRIYEREPIAAGASGRNSGVVQHRSTPRSAATPETVQHPLDAALVGQSRSRTTRPWRGVRAARRPGRPAARHRRPGQRRD